MPQTPAGPGYPVPGADPMASMQAYMQYYNQPAPSGYTAEQWSAAQQQNWTQWQQWQQQYQQWQAQYGAKYQDAMKQMSAGVGGGLSSMVQPPPLPKENTHLKPPLPSVTVNAYNSSNRGILAPQNNAPLFPMNNVANPPLPLGPPPPLAGNPNKRSASTNIVTDSAKKMKNEEEELTEAERTFDAQFKQWEEQFNKWKQQNVNHPDKAQYKQYEAKWTTWREKLIERRDQMRKKREAQRAKLEAEKKKNMAGGEKILNILSSSENQGLLNNLLGIGKTLGLTGKDQSGELPQAPILPTPATQPQMTTQGQTAPLLPIMPDMSQSPWPNQSWSGQYNMGNNAPVPGFGSFPQPPPTLSLNNPPPMLPTMTGFNQPNAVNTGVSFSQPPPGFNPGFTGMNSQMNPNNSRDGSRGQGRHEDGPSNLNQDLRDNNQQNRFNDRGPNDQYRGYDQFDRDGPRGMNSGRMNQGDGRGDFSNDRFDRGGRNFGSGGRNDFRPDSYAPQDRFNDQKAKDQDRFGSNRGPYGSNFDRGPQDRFGGDGRFNSGNDQFNSGSNRFNDDKERFGGNRSMSDDRSMPGDRLGPNGNRFNSLDGNDRRDNFGPNSRNFGKNDRFDAPPEISPELKALMEKRRAAQDVFKPSNSFLNSEKTVNTFESLGESFRKITGDTPFLSRDRSGDRGRMSPHGPSSRSGPFGGGSNIGPGQVPLSRSGPFGGGPNNSGPDHGLTSRSGPFGGGPNSGPDQAPSSRFGSFPGGPNNGCGSFGAGPNSGPDHGPPNSGQFSGGPDSGPDHGASSRQDHGPFPRPSPFGPGFNSGPEYGLSSRPGRFGPGPNNGPDHGPSSRPGLFGPGPNTGLDQSPSRPSLFGSGPNRGLDHGPSSRPGLFGAGPNSGPDNCPSSRPGLFGPGPNNGPDNGPSSRPGLFGPGPNSGPDNCPSSRPGLFGPGPNSGPDTVPASRPGLFGAESNSRPDQSPSSRSPVLSGELNSGSDNKFRDDFCSRGDDTFRPRETDNDDARDRGPGEFDSGDTGSRPKDFGSQGDNLGAQGEPPASLATSSQDVPPLEVPPWIDPNIMKSPIEPSDGNTNVKKTPDDSIGPDPNEQDKPFVNPAATSSPIAEPLTKKSEGLPFMGENDPKPEDLNMEPPPELPDLGPVKQTDHMSRDMPTESNPSGNSFDLPGTFFNGSFGGSGSFGNRGMSGPGGRQGPEEHLRGPNDPPFGMRNMGDPKFPLRGPHDNNFGPQQNPGAFGPDGTDGRFRNESGDFGPRKSNLPFGSRDNDGFGPKVNAPFDFGGRTLNPQSGPRDTDNFGPRGPPPFGPGDRDNFGPRGPPPFGPGDRENFGLRGPNSQFGPRDGDLGPRNLPFGCRDGDNFGSRGGNNSFRLGDDSFTPRGLNLGPRPPDLHNFGLRKPHDMRDRPFGSDNFMPRPLDNFGPPRGGSDSNFQPTDNDPRGPVPLMSVNGLMSQARDSRMGAMNRDRPCDRFRDEMSQPFNKSMENLRPPIGGPMLNPRDVDIRPNLSKLETDREPQDSQGPLNRDDGPFSRSGDITSSGRPAPLVQRGFNEPAQDTPRNTFSRRIDQIQPGNPRDGPIREFCAEKQFNYNHGGGVPDQVFNEYVPSKVIDYGHIKKPMQQDYVTPAQCFDYSHGKFKLTAPDHEIFPKLDFKHWVENDHNLREYDEGMRAYETRKRHARRLKQAESRLSEPRMDDRWKREEHRELGGGRYPSWDRPNMARVIGPRAPDYREYRDYDGYVDTRDSRDKRGRGRSWERDIDHHREERNRRSASKDRTREKYERSRMDIDSEFNRDDERSKGNVSRQENPTMIPKDSSPPKDISQSADNNDGSPPKTLELGKSPNYTMVDDLLCSPGRHNRPPKIAIILRGPPGSGKSYAAKLIKDKELEQGGSAPRILSLDDYFLVEKDVETQDDNGKKIINKEMVYEYEEAMEPSYIASLVKAFKKNITDGFFNFIILDAVNEKISDYEELWSFAKTKGFKVFVVEMDMDVAVCLQRNIHNRTEDEINRIIDYFEPTPSYHQKLDVTSFFQEDSIQEVHMEEAQSSTIKKQGEGNDDSQDSQDDGSTSMGVSKWEKMEAEDKLDRLDGLKRKNDGKPQTMEDFLQVPDYYNMEDNSGKKRVRWADLEERKEQEKMRAVGFVVGQTNWNRMMDPTKGGSALTRTKFFKLSK
ncbi:uncharacterized protein LOC135163087 isoform X2 [Diachasmimorpha longicaudata]